MDYWHFWCKIFNFLDILVKALTKSRKNVKDNEMGKCREKKNISKTLKIFLSSLIETFKCYLKMEENVQVSESSTHFLCLQPAIFISFRDFISAVIFNFLKSIAFK